MQLGTNIPMYIEQAMNREPQIMVMGARGNPEQSFVVVEGHAIECDSLLKAVDVCFKLTYVLDINYCWKCSHTFVFLQKCVYGLGKDDGQPLPSIVYLNNYVMQK